jgi:5-(carboxyamino)imidazole ribonucleotide synthase
MILPGATLGILGGGQLGRMTALAARELGYGVVVLDPDPECAARGVVDRVVVGGFGDPAAAATLAAASDVVTYEIEKIGPVALDAVRSTTPLRPGPHVLAAVQDRLVQKEWLVAHGFPVGPFRAADSPAALAAAARALGSCRAKSRHGGYDGRGQLRLAAPEDAERAWQVVGGAPCVVEAELDLAAELSVMVARAPSGAVALFPPARNWHVDGVLDVSVLPLPGETDDAAARALAHTRAMADAFALEGVLAVEWFVTRDGGVCVNELAPRPHNTFHTTRLACATSQFEQLVRAVCDLPLGDPSAVRPVALANLLGDLWLHGPPAFARALELPGVHLHLYGKAPRPGRKVGHLLAAGATAADALALVVEARRRIAG